MNFQFQRRYQGQIQAVILDWAGTTVDYGSCAPANVFVEVFRRKGITVTAKQAREPMGMNKKDHIRSITRMEAVARQWKEKFGTACGETEIEEMYRDFIPLQLACLKDYSDLIPGTLEAVAYFRQHQIKIGSTTGYSSDMMAILVPEAKRQGYDPDCVICSSDVPQGRPHPWMALQAAMKLQVYPMESIVKIGDTVADVEEGLNAGMWSIGLAKCGNELGLSRREVETLSETELQPKLNAARDRLRRAGAHFVVDSIEDSIPVLEEIRIRLARGERP